MVNFLYAFLKDITKARNEYLKTHSKDKYIQYLEEKNTEIVEYAEKLHNDYTALLESIEKKETLHLNQNHHRILKILVSVNDVYENDVANTIEEKIILEELVKNGYIEKVFYNNDEESYYLSIVDQKRLEILNFIKNS